MAHILRRAYYKFINGFLALDRETIAIPRKIVEILIVQRSFLELSYSCSKNQNTLEYLILLITRPQTIIQIKYVEYVSAFFSVLLIFTIFVKIPGNQYIGIYLQMIRSIAFISIFELSWGYVGYFSQVLISLIYLFDLLIIQGTLDIDTKNLQITKNNIINQLIQIINLIMVICYVQNVQMYILIILVILNSLFQLINHLQFSPTKSTHLVIIISSIYTMTLYTAANKLLHYQEDFNHELLIFPFIYRLYHTQIQKNTQFTSKINHSQLQFQQILKFKNINSTINQDEIISISEILFQNKQLTAWLKLQEIECHDTTTNFKLQALKYKCIKIIKTRIIRNLDPINDIQMTVDMLLRSENSNQTIVSSIINLIHQKIDTQSNLIESSNFSQLLQYTQSHLDLQKLLEEQYDNFPSYKTQNTLGFFYVEIANDLLAANKLFSVAAISDEHSRFKDSSVFSKQMIYIIATYTSSGLVAQKASNKAFKTLGINYEKLINQNLNFLIPNGIVEWHEILIKDFLKKGSSKFMRKLNDNYYQKLEDGLLYPIELAIDINFVKDLNFIVFIQPNASQPFTMILNQNLEITGFTEYLLQQIRVQYGALINQSIYKILSKFNSQKEYLENVEVNFGSLRNSQSISSAGSCFLTSIQIHKKVLNQVDAYFILNFEYLKRIQILCDQLKQSPIPSMQQSRIEILQVNMGDAEESVQIIQPYILDLNNEESKLEKQQEIMEHSQRANYFDVSQREDKEYSSMILSPKQSNQQFLQKQQPLYFSAQEKQSKTKKQDQSKDKSKKERIDLPAIQEDKALDDRASQISSLMGVRKSKYFKKYEIIGKLNALQAQSTRHKVVYALFLITLLFQITLALVQLSIIDLNLTNLVSDIDLLQIKNLVYQPMESFMLIRWSIFNYNGLYNSQSINQTQYIELLAYPKSNLALGYDSLAQNIYLVLNRRELQSFLQETYLEIYQYVNTNTGALYNMTLRNAVNVLLNYQYIIKMAYQIDGGPVTDSPYVYFPYRNYLPLKQTFSNLNLKILENSKIRAQNMLDESITISSISVGLLIIIQFLIYFTIHKIYYRFSLYINAVRNCEKQTFEYDIAFYKHLLEQIQNNHNVIFKFTFNLSNVESNFKQLRNASEQKRRGNQQPQKLPLYLWLLFLFALVILIGGNIILTFYQTYEYLSLYPDTANFYKQLSDVGTDIPTMYAQREVLFGRIYFPYFKITDFQAIQNEIVEALNRTLIFSQVDQDFNKLLLSTSFVDYYSKIQNNDLCQYLPPTIKKASMNICSVTMSSNLQRGLKPILIYIINFIRTDMEINGFEKRLNATYLELEGAFLVSELIKQVNTNFNQDLYKSTTDLLFSIRALNIFIQVFMFFMLIFGLQIIKYTLKQKYYLVQRFIYLVPKKSLFLDDGFERNIKILQISDSIN